MMITMTSWMLMKPMALLVYGGTIMTMTDLQTASITTTITTVYQIGLSRTTVGT